MKVELHRVRCPYPGCGVGGGVISVKRRGTAIEVDTNELVKCDTCRDARGLPNYFKVQPVFALRGVGLDYRGAAVNRLERDLRFPATKVD